MNLHNTFSAIKYITNIDELKHVRIEFLCGTKGVKVNSYTCLYTTTQDNVIHQDYPVKTLVKAMWDYTEGVGYDATDTQERNIFYKKDSSSQKISVDAYEMAFSFVDQDVKRVIVS